MTLRLAPHRLRLRRLWGLVRKESLQVVRDPSTLLIAFVLPTILLFLFAYAVSLDVKKVRLGLVVEGDGPATRELAAAFAATRYFDVTPARHRREVEPGLVAGTLRGMVVIPQDFDRRVVASSRAAFEAHKPPDLQVITDGSSPNTASFVSGYAEGVVAGWWRDRLARSGRAVSGPPVVLEPRIWFNPEVESRRFLVPGAIAIVMTTIGTLLTALVVAREWERGTMEALISTPAGIFEILLGKLLPYFALGLLATLGCGLLSIHVFQVPLRGSWGALFLLSCAFLMPALGQGLLISAVARNQFVAAQVAVFSGFLPSFLLSGFLFEIESMPAAIRAITYAVPARYFVSSLQTVFLAGDVWAQFARDVLSMLAVGAIFFALTAANTHKRLDR